MRQLKCAAPLMTALLLVAVPLSSQAQVAPPAPAPPMTLWRFLGIPQGAKALQLQMFNRRGNFPGLEPKPPLLGIADPLNLESPNPAIRKAAEVKIQEDLAKQKIKALKYLAKIGCGCYPGVKEALMAALDDCTEKVRYEAAKAIGEAATQHCDVCNERCCCDEELTLKLAEIVYERDDECCYLERSERVREAAREALVACCPGGPALPEPITPPPPVEREVPIEREVPREVPLETPPLEPTPPPPPAPAGDTTSGPIEGPAISVNDARGADGGIVVVEELRGQPGGRGPVNLPPAQGNGNQRSSRRSAVMASTSGGQAVASGVPVQPTTPTGPRSLRLVPIQADDLSARHGSPHLQVSASEVALARNEKLDLTSHVDRATELFVPAAAPQQARTPAEAKPVHGTVVRVDRSSNLVELRFPQNSHPPVGGWVLVYHQYLFERACLGALEVVDVRPGVVLARPTADMKLAELAKGDEAVARR